MDPHSNANSPAWICNSFAAEEYASSWLRMRAAKDTTQELIRIANQFLLYIKQLNSGLREN